jgi:hypothetical protein
LRQIEISEEPLVEAQKQGPRPSGLEDFVQYGPGEANSYAVKFWSADRLLHGQHVYAKDEQQAARWADAMFKEGIIREYRDAVYNSVERVQVIKQV